MRESVATKGARYLVEGRVVLRELDEHGGTVLADVRGSGAVYTCGRDARGWFCDCPARGDCAYISALKSVTALKPREAEQAA